MMNAVTGRAMQERDHIRQSIADILFTRFGTRIQRELYGSIIPELIDSPITGEVLALTIASGVFMALATYEPRIHVTNVVVDLSGIASASLSINISYEVGSLKMTESVTL